MVSKRRVSTRSTSTTKGIELPPNPFDSEPDSHKAGGDTAEQVALNSKKVEEVLLDGKKAFERRKKGVKILLLGQSESGKSAVLKNFQLAFAPKHFERERSAWKIVVQLNVIGSIKTILDALDEEKEESTSNLDDLPSNSPLLGLPKLHLSLSPLFLMELYILNVLAPGCADCRRMFVHAGMGWKTRLQETSHRADPESSSSAVVTEERRESKRTEYDPTVVLVAQRGEIIRMWNDPGVQEILRRRRPWLKGSSGFFMEDIERITTREYLPTDSDIIRARIKTLGVEEHSFKLEIGMESSPREFYVTDVGGSKGQRAMWAPFFEDAQCILFLAPLAFNETLEENSKINRLEDSFNLWREVCRNKLLSNVLIILFLNKRDVLASTLATGVQVKKYVPSFKDRTNDITTVTQFFKDEFKYEHKKHSHKPRSFICHETTAIDIHSMQPLLRGVQETIIKALFRQRDLV